MTADTEQRDAQEREISDLIRILYQDENWCHDPDADGWIFDSHTAAKNLHRAGFRRPREVATVEELDALPVGSMIREADGFFRLREPEGWILVMKLEVEPNLHPSTSVEFPAVVVFEPEKEA